MAKVRTIAEMFAFVATDPTDHTEGIVAFLHPEQGWMPMVGVDMEKVHELMPTAEAMANQFGQVITVVRFSTRETMRTIEPNPKVHPWN